MLYQSTRNKNCKVSASQAIAQGISEEGGLFVPVSIPNIKATLPELAELDYRGRAKKILSLFLDDYTSEEIDECVEKAYAPEKFGGNEPAVLKKLDNNAYMLELWHGPTCAFKDMALQILPHLLTKALKKNYDEKTAVILVATSGDTGKAALEGFKDVDNTKIIVFYPDDGVSPMQLKQMNTQEGKNVCVCAVKGNFDDCQTQVKKIFTDKAIGELLHKNNMIFSSANSINWGRLLPQIVYYISAYLDLYNNGTIRSFDEKMNVVVPTGNFGNILAAYYAYRMGIPVGRFICASNSNNVLTDFICYGTYDRSRDFFTTISPSMDILVSSNLERLLFHLSGESDEMVKGWMKKLSETGKYSVDDKTFAEIKELFYGACCNDEETKAEIASVYSKYEYLSDTHTAVAINAFDKYIKVSGDISTPTVIASTASPYKFSASVLSALSEDSEGEEFEIVGKLSQLSSTSVPEAILELKDKEIRFKNKTDRDNIAGFVLKTLGVQ